MNAYLEFDFTSLRLIGTRPGNSYVYDPNPNSFDYPSDSYHPPHPTYETHSYDSYGNDTQFSYDCQPQFPFPYESEQGYNENYPSYPYDSSSLPQQYLCCACCGGPHMNYQCQLMNQDSYNSNSLGFDQPQPPLSPVNHPIFNAHNDPLISQTTLNEQMTQLTSMCEIFCQFVQQKQEEKRIEEEQAAKAQTWKLSDDDDDEESSNSLNDNIFELPPFSAITPDKPVLSTEEPDNSLSMGDEHLDTILVTESDEFIKSGVENLIPIPSESEGIPEHMCDVPSHDNSLASQRFQRSNKGFLRVQQRIFFD
nr:hypothetical protein [Tanacetum cinerariifolium]